MRSPTFTNEERTLSDETTREPDLAGLEREAADLVHRCRWDDMNLTVYGMSPSSSDYHDRMQRIDRIDEIALLAGPEVVERAGEEGSRRYREEVAGHVRGRIPDDAVGAWLAGRCSARQRCILIRGLRGALLDKDHYDMVVREQGDDWLEAGVEREREQTRADIERLDAKVLALAEERQELVAYLEKCE